MDFEDFDYQAGFDVYDEYMDHEPDIYAGTYSEM